MNAPRQLTLTEWDTRYDGLVRDGLREPAYGGPLRRHAQHHGDRRLEQLRFDDSAAALQLWNFLLTENERLQQARAAGDSLVGAMKDLGTVPVMAYALPHLRAFYPDGSWWTPCLMECGDGLLSRAETLGIDASFCPVRAMLAAFENREHFPIPDLLLCSAGAVCDDFSAIAQRLECLGHPVFWWEMPRRRRPAPGEPAVRLPGGSSAPDIQVNWVRDELGRIGQALAGLAGIPLDEPTLAAGIRSANRIRRTLQQLRHAAYASPGAVLPALEMLIAEMLALHFCSDRAESLQVLEDLLAEAQRRLAHGHYTSPADAVRVFWVNPVADLRALNWLESWGGRICGTDYLFAHALDPIPEDLPPLEALARTALADPMVGSVQDRTDRIVADCRLFGAEALVVCRIPGASHSAWEGAFIGERVGRECGLPTIELEIPSVCDAMVPTLSGRLQALIETARRRRP